MSTKEEARSLASEIIAELQEKLEAAEKKNTRATLKDVITRIGDMEDMIDDLSSTLDKLGHIALTFSDKYGLDKIENNTTENACYFFRERGNMYLDIGILCDYFCQAKNILNDLESVR